MRAGLDVLVVETSAAAAKTARARLEASLTRAEQRGKIDDAHAVLGRIVVSTNLDDMADREMVIEAIAESRRPRWSSSHASTRSSPLPVRY